MPDAVQEKTFRNRIEKYLEDGHLSHEEEYAILLAGKQLGFSEVEIARLIVSTAEPIGVAKKQAFRLHLRLWIRFFLKNDGVIDSNEMFVLREECANKIGVSPQELERLIAEEQAKLASPGSSRRVTNTDPSGMRTRITRWSLAAVLIGIAIIVIYMRAIRPLPNSESFLPKSDAPIGAPLPLITTESTSVLIPPNSSSVRELLDQAEGLKSENRFRQAEVILTRAVQIDSGNLESWRALADTQRKMSLASIKNGELLVAAQESDRANASSLKVKAICVDPNSGNPDPEIVLEEETASKTSAEAVRNSIDAASKLKIDESRACLNEAYHSKWNILALGLRRVKNDRSKVIDGLKSLKSVIELGPWASEETRRLTNETLSDLKKLVYPEEWSDLLTRAGFESGPRTDTDAEPQKSIAISGTEL
jgi:hypothetical protein